MIRKFMTMAVMTFAAAVMPMVYAQYAEEDVKGTLPDNTDVLVGVDPSVVERYNLLEEIQKIEGLSIEGIDEMTEAIKKSNVKFSDFKYLYIFGEADNACAMVKTDLTPDAVGKLLQIVAKDKVNGTLGKAKVGAFDALTVVPNDANGDTVYIIAPAKGKLVLSNKDGIEWFAKADKKATKKNSIVLKNVPKDAGKVTGFFVRAGEKTATPGIPADSFDPGMDIDVINGTVAVDAVKTVTISANLICSTDTKAAECVSMCNMQYSQIAMPIAMMDQELASSLNKAVKITSAKKAAKVDIVITQELVKQFQNFLKKLQEMQQGTPAYGQDPGMGMEPVEIEGLDVEIEEE